LYRFRADSPPGTCFFCVKQNFPISTPVQFFYLLVGSLFFEIKSILYIYRAHDFSDKSPRISGLLPFYPPIFCEVLFTIRIEILFTDSEFPSSFHTRLLPLKPRNPAYPASLRQSSQIEPYSRLRCLQALQMSCIALCRAL